jgi:hypothetical protein
MNFSNTAVARQVPAEGKKIWQPIVYAVVPKGR